MCNISAVWNKECSMNLKHLQSFLEFGKKRGTDGFGICRIDKVFTMIHEDKDSISIAPKHVINNIKKSIGVYRQEEIIEEVYQESANTPILNSIILANHRAAPETEVGCTDDKSIQPIVDERNGLVLIHNGAVSNFIYKELENPNKISNIDSEAILWAYLRNSRDIKKTMEYLSGGFAFILFDQVRQVLIISCTHNPLYCGYVRGYGMFFNSQQEAVWDAISSCKGFRVREHNLSVFEDYYCREIKENTVETIDLYTGMTNTQIFEPRYITNNWDTLKPDKSKYPFTEKKVVLVAASGGLDSTTTLVTLKEADYCPIAVHFKYGHRGEDAEHLAILKITEKLKIHLKVFDISTHIKELDPHGMLTNRDAKIKTGTDDGLKTTMAWVTWRNGFFLSYMAAYAEKLIIENNLPNVWITGGFMNLSESGVYGDNSERFLKSFLKFNKFASIVGNRVLPLYGLCNILKTEQYHLLQYFNQLENLSKYLVSCDRPKVIDGEPYNCFYNGMPACGSGLLSYWACKAAGLQDLRNYYQIDKEYIPYSIKVDQKPISRIEDIINKLEIHSENKEKLLERTRL